MPAIAYRNTIHTIPNWVPFQTKEPRGLAYETETHFVHFFGKGAGLWVVSPGLTVTQQKAGDLRDWAVRVFGAQDIEEVTTEVGHTVAGVWRPGLYFTAEIEQGLNVSPHELRLCEQALVLLIERLDELLLFVEPAETTLDTFSHKGRELLILAATEVENYWKHYVRIAQIHRAGRDHTTADYVRLKGPLFLDQYEVVLARYAAIPPVRPFFGWDANAPTQSLCWYDAYNKSKHDRTENFSFASLRNCVSAVCANIVLFSVRFGPFRLFQGGGTLSALINQLFSIELRDCSPSSFYVPSVELPANQRNDLICFSSQEIIEPRIVDPLHV
jgi:hypothetical protein